nr:hypothetical protein GCM10020093_048550 [Planobispora longispora]
MAVAADARALVSKGDRFHPVDGAQVMQVFGAGSLQPALVSGQERLPDARRRFRVALEQCPDLFDHVGESDAVRETMTFDARGPELATALLVDLLGDLRRGASRGQASRPDLPR